MIGEVLTTLYSGGSGGSSSSSAEEKLTRRVPLDGRRSVGACIHRVDVQQHANLARHGASVLTGRQQSSSSSRGGPDVAVLLACCQ